jgi:hypothetical protein|tara:strand:- start:462 stop:878 length:417 start_codon:yes stop_codon:yes gene_type:complete
MEKKNLLDRLSVLLKLCEDTEPTTLELCNITNLKLFSEDLIAVKRYYNDVKTTDQGPIEIMDIMTNCNWMWKKRLKIKELGWNEYINVDQRIEESLKANRKIEAIKLYRQNIIDNGGDCQLREAKEYIDKLQVKMGLV